MSVVCVSVYVYESVYVCMVCVYAGARVNVLLTFKGYSNIF